MILQKKNIFLEMVEDKAALYQKNLINTNPTIMKKLCQQDPGYIRYVQGAARTVELLDIVMSHPDFEEGMLIDALTYDEGLASSPEIMKKLCSINGNYFRYCRDKALTYAMYELAQKAEEPKIKDIDLYLSSMNFETVKSPEDIKKFLAIDGSIIRHLDIKYITKEMIEIALNNPNPNKRPMRYDLCELQASKKHMRYLCEIDGLYFLDADEDTIDETLIKIATNHPDPSKRLTFDRIPDGYNLDLDYETIKDLIEEDERWLKYIDLQTISREKLIDILKTDKVVPTAKIIRENKDNKEILDVILQSAKNGFYSLEDMSKMLYFSVDRKFINSKFFNEFSKIICEKANIDCDVFQYIINRAIAFNSEILMTINYELLDKRFHKIYEGNGFEKLFSLCVYRDIQDIIVQIGNPRNFDNEIDYELGDKRLELLNRMLTSALTDKKGNKVLEWIPYYSKIIKGLNSKPGLLNYFANHIDELDEKRLATLTNHILGNHSFRISTIEDLDNYEDIRNEWINMKSNSSLNREVKDAAFEKVFGISIKTAEELLPYCDGVLMSKDSFHPHIVEFVKVVKQIINEENMDLLRETIKAFEKSEALDEKAIIHFRTMLKKDYLKEYNKVLFDPTGKSPDRILGGVRLYHAGGKNGDQDFSLCIHAVGAYMSSSDTSSKKFNFKDDWNRPLISNHGICSSFISSNHLGTAINRSVIYGFTDYEEGSLLLSGPTDIYSSNESFDTMGDEDKKSKYLLPRDMVDQTRHTHNEMVFERRIGNQKRQPNYIVLMCDDYDKAILKYHTLKALGRYSVFKKTLSYSHEAREADAIHYALKAANDFGIPIVVVEREKVAKQQHKKIMTKLEEFKNDTEMNRDEVKEYMHDIITNLANNHTGNRDYHHNIDEKYFSKKVAEKVTDEIKEKIEIAKQTDPSLALILIEELEKVIVSEEKKCAENYIDPLFDITGIKIYCNNGKQDLRLANRDNLSIICVFSDEMSTTSNLMEYDRWVSGTIAKEYQYYYEDIKTMLDDTLIDKILLTVDVMNKENLYSGKEGSVHSKRHIEDVILFAALIGKTMNIDEKDMDLVLKAAMYHDCGRKSDGRVPHAQESSLIAQEKLKGKIPEEDLKVIMAAIEYHEIEEKLNPMDNSIITDKLVETCQNVGINPNNKKLIERTKKVAFILKDADALDRTRFLAETPSFVNPQKLHYKTSKKLIRFASQLNERYATKDIEAIMKNQPELYEVFKTSLETTKNPKKTLRLYRTGKLTQETFEEETGYGTKK